MSPDSKPAPKAFVSYAHESPVHRTWVRSLASALREGGIDALLDQWRVPLGGDFTLFMDHIGSCDRVLLICTPAYARKSREGVGGVGYERCIITAELAKKVATRKFICVLRAGSPEEGIPEFVRGRRYIDFRDDTQYAHRLEELLRDLHGMPVDPEPPLGKNPFAEGALPSRLHSMPVGAGAEPNSHDDVNLAYRQRLPELSPAARLIIQMFESGAERAEIIDHLSWPFHRGGGRALAPDERRAGEIEFVRLMAEIRKVLGS